ncbi:alpha/beta hydrolase [Polyangium sp. 6x1]|uniref:alpha/beta hydrolase n=1 Tax=Polyangium sp. 6x1 TaxID=3042689 RepID=UPI002482467C|nr:alpha/beta hydrolase [Polyangium sp. 6x1]MDI1451786.1 alpha/beta hydrolase [Polyangium sp. 6x1]
MREPEGTFEMKEETFEGKGGLKIFMRSWRPGTPRAVVVLVHGFKAHSGLYEWTAEQLVEHGFSVFALDHRGHGRSEGERLYVDKFSDYVEDVHTLVRLAKSREPGLPVFLLGHSAGGVISSIYTLEHGEELAGFICESFAHEVPAPDFALAILKGLSHIVPHAHVLKLNDDDFSRDKSFVEQMKNDPLIERAGYPTQTVAEMVRADERLKREFPQITLPVLILHGTEDRVTVPHGSQLFHEKAGSKDKTLKLYEGHFHDLLADVGKEGVLRDIVEWMTARM